MLVVIRRYTDQVLTCCHSDIIHFAINRVNGLLDGHPDSSILHTMRIADNPGCTFCERDTETLLHLFWECRHTRAFWNSLTVWISNNSRRQADLQLTSKSVFFLEIDDIDPILRFIIILAKYFIFRCKMIKNKPSLTAFKNVLSHRYIIEKDRIQLNPSLTEEVFDKLWANYKPLV